MENALQEQIPITHRRRQGGEGGSAAHKFLAYLVILCIERRCSKQNTVARLSKDLPPKKLWAGYATAITVLYKDVLHDETFQ